MTKRRISRAFIILAALLIASAAVADDAKDWSWQTKTTTEVEINGQYKTMNASLEKTALKANVARVDSVETGLTQYLNFGRQKAVILDNNTKTFVTLTIPQMAQQKMQDQRDLEQALQHQEQALPGMPEDQRVLAAAQIEGHKARLAIQKLPQTVQPTDEHEQIGGHDCLKYDVMAGGKKYREVWVAQDMPLDTSFKTYYASGMPRLDRAEFFYLMRLDNFPIKVVTWYGPVRITSISSDISNDKLPPDVFILPEDAKRSDNVITGN